MEGTSTQYWRGLFPLDPEMQKSKAFLLRRKGIVRFIASIAINQLLQSEWVSRLTRIFFIRRDPDQSLLSDFLMPEIGTTCGLGGSDHYFQETDQCLPSSLPPILRHSINSGSCRHERNSARFKKESISLLYQGNRPMSPFTFAFNSPAFDVGLHDR